MLREHSVYLLLGANLGDRRRQLLLARYLLGRLAGRVEAVSSVYVTAPWGNANQPDYYNQALRLRTGLGPFQLLNTLRRIEKHLGRRVKNQNTARTIDIDILFYDSLVLDTPVLTIPHPRLHRRNFTLQPLAEIAGGWVHPVFNKSIAALQKDCDDTGKVAILAG